MRISEQKLSETAWYLRPFFWNQRRKYGQVLKPALLWARVPKLFMTIAILYGVLDRKSSPVDPVLRSLENSQLLESQVEPSTTGPPRRYYEITDRGRETLLEWIEIWGKIRDFVEVSLEGVGND